LAGQEEPMEVGAFIDKWLGIKGGAERANYGQFINDFCQALSIPVPGVAEQGALSDYQFDGPIPGGALAGGTGFADLYKRGAFILEAKQSKLSEADRKQPELFDASEAAPVSPSGARYDRLMRDALAQAKRYAVNLPGDHPWPPFLIVCDVGRAFELYFDWSGNGRGYGYFPDQQSYRYSVDRFTDEEVQKLFRAIWVDPASVDPRAKSAEVSRGIAKRLADVSQWLEGAQKVKTSAASDSERSLAIEDTALFLMRIIFCMFAEDVGLLPKASFTAFLEDAVPDQRHFDTGLAELWAKMGDGNIQPRWSWVIKDEVRYFNGGLFASAKTYVLSDSDRGELLQAAKADWTKVEPAIFGTLLEQALTATERSKLGAHYTPRPYVERLVQATIMDVLEAEWEVLLPPSAVIASEAKQSRLSAGDSGLPRSARNDGSAEQGFLEQARTFHARIAALRILDPACGTGNFLYVAMENLMRLESDVIETIRQLGGRAEPKVGPQQFLGLELNPRAAVIAELVLWIGWLRWRMKNDPDAAPEPVLKQYGNINFGGHAGYDAVLRRKPTGEADVDHPVQPDWPEADFIIGNPPFIGGQNLRDELGGDYAEALWKANPRVDGSADFVMQWWDRAAHLLVAEGSPLLRFGFVTTNSITQTFSRRVIEGYLSKIPPRNGEEDREAVEGPVNASSDAKDSSTAQTGPSVSPRGLPPPRSGADQKGLSLILAIPDHPWIKPSKGQPKTKGKKGSGGPAAVRIAMTVAERGNHFGKFITTRSEAKLDSDTPEIDYHDPVIGPINADLTTGTDVTQTVKLIANTGICHDGVKLHGKGFSITKADAIALGLGKRTGLGLYIRPYRNGMDLTGRTPSSVEGKYVIDLFGLDEKQVRQDFPEVYQHVLSVIKPERDRNSRQSYRDMWWIFGEPRREMRPALAGLPRYIGTVDTAKHRVFQFLTVDVLCDDKVVVVADMDAATLGILSSSIHVSWSIASGGWMGVGNDSVYVKTKTFDPFPFPDATPAQRAVIADLAEELDEQRKEALAETPGLTMTEIYNLREWVRSNIPSPLAGEGGPKGRERGQAASAAQETPAPTSAEESLAAQTRRVPSPQPSPARGEGEKVDRARAARAGIVNRLHEQIDAAVADAYGWPATLSPSEIVTRLVALNAERAAEEKAGHIRWLRPDYQIPRFAPKT
jgi:hypothetical protein